MTKRRFFTLTAAAVAALALALTAGLVLTAPAALPWSVFGSSGNASSSTSYDLGSTSGQSSPIGESASTSYDLCAGFWCGAGIPTAPVGPTPTPAVATATPTPTNTPVPPTDTPTPTNTPVPPTDTPTPTNTPVPSGPTPTPTKDPTVDTDNDGCTDVQEQRPKSEVATGGGRDPKYYWDFMDMWINKSKDKVVNILDIGALVQRFGAIGDPNGDPLDPPQALTGYHVSADRSEPIGPNVWNAGPPNGVANIIEIGLVVVQFGHNCLELP